jgi:hypothetical protein
MSGNYYSAVGEELTDVMSEPRATREVMISVQTDVLKVTVNCKGAAVSLTFNDNVIVILQEGWLTSGRCQAGGLCDTLSSRCDEIEDGLSVFRCDFVCFRQDSCTIQLTRIVNGLNDEQLYILYAKSCDYNVIEYLSTRTSYAFA